MTKFKELLEIGQSGQDIADALLPSQVIVTRPEGYGVWVRFVGENGVAPETYLLSTVAGVPAGSTGWVETLPGGKGLFIATGIVIPQSKGKEGGTTAITRSTAGTSVANAPMLVFTGLIPSRTYTVTWSENCRYATTQTGIFRLSVQVVGATTIIPGAGQRAHGAVNTDSPGNGGTTMQPNSDGVITIVPAVTWVQGTIHIGSFEISATVS